MSIQHTLLALALCAAPAAAGTVPVVVTGHVSGNSLTDAPFAGMPAGTQVKMWYQLSTPGIDLNPGHRMVHIMVPGSFTIDVAGAQAHFTTTGEPPALTITNDYPVADGLFSFLHGITVPAHALECELHDSTGTAFNTTDIAQLVGTHPGSAFDSVDWNILGPGGGMSIALDSFTIYGDVSSPLGESYCTSTPNSSGGAAVISATGCPSVAIGAVTLGASSMPANKASRFFYGSGTTQTPLGNGFLCVDGPLFRFPVGMTSTGGTIQHVIDFQSAPVGMGAGMIQPGSTWRFQAWFRDGIGATNTTDATAIVFAP